MLFTQGNLVMTRPVHAAGGGDRAAVLATLSSQSNDQHLLVLYPSCARVSFTTSGISSASGLVGLGHPLLAKAAVDTYKCFPIWTFLFWIPFLVQVTSHHSITVCHTVHEMHIR
jgi:hypothetical protein